MAAGSAVRRMSEAGPDHVKSLGLRQHQRRLIERNAGGKLRELPAFATPASPADASAATRAWMDSSSAKMRASSRVRRASSRHRPSGENRSFAGEPAVLSPEASSRMWLPGLRTTELGKGDGRADHRGDAGTAVDVERPARFIRCGEEQPIGLLAGERALGQLVAGVVFGTGRRRGERRLGRLLARDAAN